MVGFIYNMLVWIASFGFFKRFLKDSTCVEMFKIYFLENLNCSCFNTGIFITFFFLFKLFPSVIWFILINIFQLTILIVIYKDNLLFLKMIAVRKCAPKLKVLSTLKTDPRSVEHGTCQKTDLL